MKYVQFLAENILWYYKWTENGWGAVDFRICLHQQNVVTPSYEFCPHLAQLDNLDSV